MRNSKDLTPNRYKTVKTSGSNKFVSTFLRKDHSEGIVEKRNTKYNWVGYKWAVVFTTIIGILTYLVVDFWLF